MIYTVRTSDGCRFLMSYFDPPPEHQDGTYPIRIYIGPGDVPRWWTTMPFGVGDVRDAEHAAELVQKYLDSRACVETVEQTY